MGKYTTSPLWTDIVPIPQDDGGPHPLAAIAYTDEYAEAMSYLRAAMAGDEKSDRVLKLTEDVIRMNPAHYTVWLYRAATVAALEKDLEEELEWLNRIALKSLKNYQIWHHRQTIMSQLPSLPPHELAFLATMFDQDAKNYHVWSYRQWLVQHFSLWPDNPSSTELAYVEHLLALDVRNNSAWNHRWFLVFGRAEKSRHDRAAAERKAAASSAPTTTPAPEINIDASIIAREINYTHAAIHIAPQNPSPWNYLRGLLRFTSQPLHTQRAFAERFADVDRADDVRSSHALDFLADVYSAPETGDVASAASGGGLEVTAAAGSVNEAKDMENEGKEKAGRALELLARRYDPIRRNYWNWRRGLIGLGEVSDVEGVEV